MFNKPIMEDDLVTGHVSTRKESMNSLQTIGRHVEIFQSSLFRDKGQ